MVHNLLTLSKELRLQIYELVMAGPAEPDSIDILKLMHYETSHPYERNTSRSYSLIFTNAQIFNEARDLVAKTHPLVVFSVTDLRFTLYSFHKWMSKARSVKIEIRNGAASMIPETLALLADLPSLKSIGVGVSAFSVEFDDIKLPPSGRFAALQRLYVYDCYEDRNENETRRLREHEEEILRKLHALSLTGHVERATRLKIHAQQIGVTRLKRSVRAFKLQLGDFGKLNNLGRIEAINRKLDMELQQLRLDQGSLGYE